MQHKRCLWYDLPVVGGGGGCVKPSPGRQPPTICAAVLRDSTGGDGPGRLVIRSAGLLTAPVTPAVGLVGGRSWGGRGVRRIWWGCNASPTVHDCRVLPRILPPRRPIPCQRCQASHAVVHRPQKSVLSITNDVGIVTEGQGVKRRGPIAMSAETRRCSGNLCSAGVPCKESRFGGQGAGLP